MRVWQRRGESAHVRVWYAITLMWVVVPLDLAAASEAEPGQRDASTSATRSLMQDATVHVPAFDLPLSGFLGEQSRAALRQQARDLEALGKECPAVFRSPARAEDVVAIRRCLDDHWYPPLIARYRARYPVTIESRAIAGVATRVVSPAEPMPRAHAQRLLINLHGGGFMYGGGQGGEVESIPVASIGRIKVVSVDYRMAPEHRFPAASEDVAAVYRALLADYRPENIGLYGCSAGGLLAAQTGAWLQKAGLPAPGAVGLFCAGVYDGGAIQNDSGAFAGAITGPVASPPATLSYIPAAESRNPLAYPGLEPQVLASFPDSLLITAIRDASLSTVVATHAHLVRAGRFSALHVWEGLGHAFFYEPDLPESREAYAVISRFFNERLGRAR
jgi:monoterpene epsilon-lactone hydrolase